jgi:hypothetical protein
MPLQVYPFHRRAVPIPHNVQKALLEIQITLFSRRSSRVYIYLAVMIICVVINASSPMSRISRGQPTCRIPACQPEQQLMFRYRLRYRRHWPADCSRDRELDVGPCVQ